MKNYLALLFLKFSFNFAFLVFIGFTPVIVEVEQHARKEYLEDTNSYKVSLGQIQALILLKSVSTAKGN